MKIAFPESKSSTSGISEGIVNTKYDQYLKKQRVTVILRFS